MVRIILAVAILACLSSCKDPPTIDQAAWKARGAEAVLPLKKGLKQALVAGMKDGPVQAISACNLEAPKIADAASQGGVRVGRTSAKLRNSKNAPAPWMQPVLEVYAGDLKLVEPTVVVIDDKTIGYAEPIVVQPLCVTCHGAQLAPELQAKLAELYPDDQATGYAAGEFRGLFWAELPRP